MNAPDAIRTQIDRSAGETRKTMKNLLNLVHYGRIDEPADIGQTVLWLAFDLSDHMDGITIFVDDGMSAYRAFRGAE